MGVYGKEYIMNINNTEDLNKLELSDYFEAVASERKPVPVYKDGKEIEAHHFSKLGKISYSDAMIVLNINKELREKFIEAYPEYGASIAKVGDVIKFGSYWQGDLEKKDSIEWIVLSRDRNSLKLVSKYGLDCKPYNVTYENITWENSTLRKWLNSEFIANAFTQEEKMMIPYTSVKIDDLDNIYANHGNNTSDKVFLLSATEAKLYFESNEARQCKATKYAVSKGAYENGENGNCWYWLRTPGWAPMAYCQTDVKDKGDISLVGDSVEHIDNDVRPAIWIGVE